MTGKLTPGEQRYIDQLVDDLGGRRTFRVKACFGNAQRLMLADKAKRLRYCEGYMNSGYGAIPHAWVTINGKVVDLTMEAYARHVKRGRTELARLAGQAKSHPPKYYSIVVSRRTLQRHMLASRWHEAVIPDLYSALKQRRKQRAKQRKENQ